MDGWGVVTYVEVCGGGKVGVRCSREAKFLRWVKNHNAFYENGETGV